MIPFPRGLLRFPRVRSLLLLFPFAGGSVHRVRNTTAVDALTK